MNLKESIANANDGNLRAVEVPEWSTTVHIKELAVKDRLALMQQIDKAHDGTFGVFVLLHTLADENGKLVFSEEDYDLLASRNAKVVDRLAKVAYEVNGMQAGALDDAKKN